MFVKRLVIGLDWRSE